MFPFWYYLVAFVCFFFVGLVWFFCLCYSSFLLSVILPRYSILCFCNTVLSMCSPVFFSSISPWKGQLFSWTSTSAMIGSGWIFLGVCWIQFFFFFWCLLVCFYLVLKSQIRVSHLVDILHHTDKTWYCMPWCVILFLFTLTATAALMCIYLFTWFILECANS